MIKNLNKKEWAVIIIFVGVMGFILGEGNKSSYRIFDKRLTINGEYHEEVLLISGLKYVVSVFGSDEELGFQRWAKLDFNLLVSDYQGDSIIQKKISASEAREKGGKRRVVDGLDFHYVAKYPDKLFIKINFMRGDDLDIKIYENIPEFANFLPSIFIFVFIFGIFYYLRVRNQ